tara:strand:- start:3160 stop:4008 length:849 start_codon:yes stop_codon:yes gene_type:complete
MILFKFNLKYKSNCKKQVNMGFNKCLSKKLYLTLFLLMNICFSQDSNKSKQYHFDGNVNITNNGFSFIPLFSLGKPATTVNLSIGDDRLTFDPQFRFDLEGLKPWSILFTWHYKLIQKKRFRLKIGAYLPAYAFNKISYEKDGDLKENLNPQRYFITDLSVSYLLNKNMNIGLFYLRGMGLESEDQTKTGNFISLRSNVRNIKISNSLNLIWSPEFYYLKVDENDGIFSAQTINLMIKNSHFNFSTTMNKAIESRINAKSFDWNIGINYAFSNKFIKKKKTL